MENPALSLSSHDQEMHRANRLNAALLMCKQTLLQWNSQNYQIFERELGINVERASGVISNIIGLQTNYLKSDNEASSWLRNIFDLHSFNIAKSIVIYEVDNTRVISLRFPLPPMVLKVPEKWNKDLRNIIIDFSFYIEIIRTSSFSDDCSTNNNTNPRYFCKATPLVRFENDSTSIGYNAIHQIFTTSSSREIERISVKLSSRAEDCNLLMRLLRELYLATLSRRLNDISDEFANPASHTVDLFLGICFEACKLNQVWNNFIRNDIILWDESHATRRENHGSVNNQMCIREFSRATRNWPSEGATLQRLVRSNHRLLTEWSCCTRESCPLQEQGQI